MRSSKTGISTSTVVIPSPTQANSISRNCIKYAEALSGDCCSKFATANNITTAELYEWNTVLGTTAADCGTELQANVSYCVGVNGELSNG
ncbi:hypothetical protein PDIG_12980 [Penicillium digitatum PHI26]|uniref:LysM domain-containing protein n=2 Tax=Penicillium digitatum TaxID=36651 RepID=K9G7K1_PEND2|nr:hypothetical protein PDIP_39200 [Penicillium digitatum Pd1]EKV15845.1 hypothetical protein PDIP_39200 [Penicillium digitatum Pd1]EKV17910.1 hypothetical protein PDIG_12980 [Penicillium digitatum PHI26]